MLIKEYRIILPISVQQYEVGHLWTTLKSDNDETGGGEGIEVIINEPREFSNGLGLFIHKVLHLATKVPRVVRSLAPRGSLEIHQKTKYTFPYVSTEQTDPAYMKDNFSIEVNSWHKEDFGEIENVHNLTSEELENREVVYIDFVNDTAGLHPTDFKESEDPTKVAPKTSMLGPLSSTWLEDLKSGKYPSQPYMCAYKLVRAEFKWFGLQDTVEKRIHKFFRRYMMKFHRQMYCSMDKWTNFTIPEIRKLEEETKRELNKKRLSGEPIGMFEK